MIVVVVLVVYQLPINNTYLYLSKVGVVSITTKYYYYHSSLAGWLFHHNPAVVTDPKNSSKNIQFRRKAGSQKEQSKRTVREDQKEVLGKTCFGRFRYFCVCVCVCVCLFC